MDGGTAPLNERAGITGLGEVNEVWGLSLNTPPPSPDEVEIDVQNSKQCTSGNPSRPDMELMSEDR